MLCTLLKKRCRFGDRSAARPVPVARSGRFVGPEMRADKMSRRMRARPQLWGFEPAKLRSQGQAVPLLRRNGIVMQRVIYCNPLPGSRNSFFAPAQRPHSAAVPGVSGCGRKAFHFLTTVSAMANQSNRRGTHRGNQENRGHQDHRGAREGHPFFGNQYAGGDRGNDSRRDGDQNRQYGRSSGAGYQGDRNFHEDHGSRDRYGDNLQGRSNSGYAEDRGGFDYSRRNDAGYGDDRGSGDRSWQSSGRGYNDDRGYNGNRGYGNESGQGGSRGYGSGQGYGSDRGYESDGGYGSNDAYGGRNQQASYGGGQRRFGYESTYRNYDDYGGSGNESRYGRTSEDSYGNRYNGYNGRRNDAGSGSRDGRGRDEFSGGDRGRFGYDDTGMDYGNDRGGDRSYGRGNYGYAGDRGNMGNSGFGDFQDGYGRRRGGGEQENQRPRFTSYNDYDD